MKLCAVHAHDLARAARIVIDRVAAVVVDLIARLGGAAVDLRVAVIAVHAAVAVDRT